MRNRALKKQAFMPENLAKKEALQLTLANGQRQRKKIFNVDNSKDAASKKGKVNQSLTIQSILTNKLDRLYTLFTYKARVYP